MPKINVYLPEGLAEAVKEAGIPVSAVCQHALELAVRRMAAVRETVAGGLDAAAAHRDGPLVSLTRRAYTILQDAQQRARAEGNGAIQTQHVLSAILAEGGNLALRVLSTLDITPAQLQYELDHLDRRDRGGRDLTGSSPAEHTEAVAGRQPAGVPESAGAPESAGPPFGPHSAAALELAASEATGLGNNYIGTEHLLLGLIAEPDGGAGQALRGLGAELRVTRRAVAAALAGYYHHGRSGDHQGGSEGLAEVVSAEVGRQLAPILARLDSLERPAPAAGPA